MRFSATKLALMMMALAIPTITTGCTQEPQQEQSAATVSETAAAEALVKRLTPQFASRVRFCLDTNAATPTISGKGANILITAANERECIRAYGHYLRNIAHVHFSWNGNNATGAQFVVPTTQVKVPAALPFNYAYNY
jgi:alpha-N-acetylglucosaminidase